MAELSVGERVQTPLGYGEIRYVSGDGVNAAIRLDSDYEVWLPAERISVLAGRERCARERILEAARLLAGRLSGRLTGS